MPLVYTKLIIASALLKIEAFFNLTFNYPSTRYSQGACVNGLPFLPGPICSFSSAHSHSNSDHKLVGSDRIVSPSMAVYSLHAKQNVISNS